MSTLPLAIGYFFPPAEPGLSLMAKPSSGGPVGSPLLESVKKVGLPPPSERKIVTKETHQGCLSFSIHHPGAFMPPAVPRRPQAAESKPPPPLRPRGDGENRGLPPPRNAPIADGGAHPGGGRLGAPPNIDQSRGRAGEGPGLAATPGAAGSPQKPPRRHGRREVRSRSRGHPWPGVGRRVARILNPRFGDEKRGRSRSPSRISLIIPPRDTR